MNFTACDHHVQNVVSRKVFNLESMTGFTESMASGVHVCVRIHVCMLCVPVCAHVRVCMCAGICSCVCVCVCEHMPVHFWELVSALQSHCQRHTDPNAQITDEETEVQGGPERVQVPRKSRGPVGLQGQSCGRAEKSAPSPTPCHITFTRGPMCKTRSDRPPSPGPAGV